MSVHISAAIWDLDLEPTVKLVALAIADAANREGGAWPSIKTLARFCNVDERTIQRHIRTLENQGVIKRDERFNHGRQTSNMYQFTERVVRPDLRGDNGASRGDTHVTPPVTPMSPPNNEPCIEPWCAPALSLEMIPSPLRKEEFRDAWEKWVKHLQDHRKRIGDVQRDMLWKECMIAGVEQSVRVILACIKSGKVSLYFDVKLDGASVAKPQSKLKLV